MSKPRAVVTTSAGQRRRDFVEMTKFVMGRFREPVDNAFCKMFLYAVSGYKDVLDHPSMIRVRNALALQMRPLVTPDISALYRSVFVDEAQDMIEFADTIVTGGVALAASSSTASTASTASAETDAHGDTQVAACDADAQTHTDTCGAGTDVQAGTQAGTDVQAGTQAGTDVQTYTTEIIEAYHREYLSSRPHNAAGLHEAKFPVGSLVGVNLPGMPTRVVGKVRRAWNGAAGVYAAAYHVDVLGGPTIYTADVVAYSKRTHEIYTRVDVPEIIDHAQ
jgi:hypothetical protein